MSLSIVFCGDTTLGAGDPKAYPFQMVEAFVRSADIAFCNLETCLTEAGERALKRHVISDHPQAVSLLKRCGFTVVNLANNHILDMGIKSSIETVDVLRDNGIGIVGLRDGVGAAPLVLERKGIKVGFLGYADYGFRDFFMPLRPNTIIQDVERLVQKVNVVIVSLHWGYEYVGYPLPSQQRLAKRIIDAGAQLVIGHHPHVMQGLETYRDGLIAYSLGNFQFKLDQTRELRDMNSGFVLGVSLDKVGKLTLNCLPVLTDDAGRVRPLDGEASRRVMDKLTKLSRDLSEGRVTKMFWLKEASRFYYPMQLDTWRYRIIHYGWKEVVKMIRWIFEPLHLALLFVYLPYMIFNKMVLRSGNFKCRDAT